MHRKLRDQNENPLFPAKLREPRHPWDTGAAGNTCWTPSSAGSREGGTQVVCQVGYRQCPAPGTPWLWFNWIWSIGDGWVHVWTWSVPAVARETIINWLPSRKHLGNQWKSTSLKEKWEILPPTKGSRKSISRNRTEVQGQAMGRVQPKCQLLQCLEPVCVQMPGE